MIWCQGCFNCGQSGLKSPAVQLVRHATRVLTLVATLFHLPLVAAPFIYRQPTNQVAYPGQNVMFNVGVTGAPPITFQWRKDATNLPSATNVNLFLPSVQMDDAGRYAVLVTDTTGSILSSQAMLAVTIPVAITQQPVSQNVPVGASVSFFVAATGGPPFTYQWAFNGTPLPGATNQFLNIAPVMPGNAGNYAVRIWNSFGNFADSQAAALVVDGGPPLFATQPQGQIVPAGSPVVMSVAVSGSQPIHFQWRFNGADMLGGTNDALLLDGAQLANAGNYDVLASNAFGLATSEVARLEVILPELPFADNFAEAVNLQNTLAITGHALNLGATLEPGEPYHDGRRTDHSIWLAWTAPSNGIATVNTVGSDFDTVLAVYAGNLVNALVPLESDDDSGTNHTSKLAFNALAGVTYHIAVAGHLHAAGNLFFELQLQPTTEHLPVFLAHPQSRSVAPGGNATMAFTLDSLEPVQIEWLFRGLAVANTDTNSNDFIGIDENQVGTYRARITTPTRVVYSRIAELQINSRGLSNVLARDKLGDAIDFGLFANVGTALQPLEILKAGSGVADGKSGGSGSRGYTTTQIFSTVGSTADPGEPNHCGVAAGKSEWYAYQAETDGTLRIDTEGSSFDTVLAVYIGPGDSYSTLTNVACDNNSGSNGLTSKVIFQATSNTIYWIAVDGVTNASPQSGTVKLHMNLGNPVTVDTPPQSVTVPSGANAAFAVSANGMTNYTYQWRFGGTNLAHATNSTYTRTNVQVSQAGAYDVVIKNPINSVTSSVATLTVYSGTLIITNHPQSALLVAGTSLTFAVGASGVAPIAYQWRFNGTNLTGKTNSTLALSNVQPPDGGTYSVNVSDANGSLLSSNAALTVWVAPAIALHPASRTAATGSVVTLTASATGTPAPAYQWFFNGAPLAGATSGALNLSGFQSANEGVYSMTASNGAGVAQTVGAEVLLNSPLRFINAGCSNGVLCVRLIGVVNTNYILQWSTNLTEWHSQVTNSSSAGILQFSIPATNGPLRAWRALAGP